LSFVVRAASRFVFRSAIKELINSRRKLIGVFFILIIGFLGPLMSSSVETSVSDYLELRSRQLLSADLAIANIREFKPEEARLIDHVSHNLKKSESTEFVTMAKGRDVSTLIEIQAVDENFPIYGAFSFKDGRELMTAQKLGQEDIAWVFPELLSQLGLKEGDTLSVGALNLKIAGTLKDAPGLSRGGVFAPKVFIGRNKLARTGLTQFGSQVSYRIYLQLRPKDSPEVIGASAKSIIGNSDLTIRTPEDSTQSLERFFTFFNLYLVSVSMIIFALSWISAFYILQIYLQERIKNSAVLLTFGASRTVTLAISALQIFFVMLASLVVASIVVAVAISFGARQLVDVLPPGFDLRFTIADFVKLLLISLVSSAAFLVPTLIRLRTAPLADLLSESPGGLGRMTFKKALAAYSPLVLVFIGLSIWLMNSLRNAFFLSGGLLVIVGLGWILARLFFKTVFALLKAKPGAPRLVATQLARSRFGTNLCFITLLIGTLVLNIVPHLMSSALKEIEPLQGRQVPALFLFNIPESGVDDLKSFALKHAIQLKYLAPMVLARVAKVNGEPPKNDMFQRFPVRLTYRPELIAAEKLLRGSMPVEKVKDGEKAAISVEDGFAERTGLEFGDDIEFEVQGVPVEAKITSVRKVRWTDFNPNFFMVLQPGAIDDAPKTYLASVYLDSDLKNRDELKSRTQYDLVHDFPDLSVIDVGRTLDKILEIVRSILGPLKVAAAIAVLMSFLILIGVITHNLVLRGPELDIQKLLGANTAYIRRLIVSEYLILAAGAAILGSAFAIGLTAVVTSLIFEIQMRIDVEALLFSLAATLLLTAGLSFVIANRVLALRGATTKL
jgi:putative ABC transport system permease protein